MPESVRIALMIYSVHKKVDLHHAETKDAKDNGIGLVFAAQS